MSEHKIMGNRTIRQHDGDGVCLGDLAHLIGDGHGRGSGRLGGQNAIAVESED